MSSLSISTATAFSLCSKPFPSVQSPPHQAKLFPLRFHHLRFQGNHGVVMKKNRRGFGAVCYSAPLTPRNLQWVCTVSSAVLMLSRGTAAQKSFLVPFFALQAPTSIISWIKGEYGAWTAFLALLVRLFFFIPGGFCSYLCFSGIGTKSALVLELQGRSVLHCYMRNLRRVQ
ncbi:hypothetical protein PVL29_013185 [Vitis rotundifolia]|uniref:Uncharacterized protein n=1 Tax=Vitis rotundifolia TaxID=103349 RepID=A0AA38ZKR9_VITRO|nr:hypothetical protein PVL29_013185 [Vitis rotundifolia]